MSLDPTSKFCMLRVQPEKKMQWEAELVYTVAGAGWTVSVKMLEPEECGQALRRERGEHAGPPQEWTETCIHSCRLWPWWQRSPSGATTLFHGGEHTHTPDPKSERKWRKTKWWKERNGRPSCCFTPRNESAEHSDRWSSTVWKELTMFLPLCCLASLQFRKVRRHSLFSPPFLSANWRNQPRRERERKYGRPRPCFYHYVRTYRHKSHLNGK